MLGLSLAGIIPIVVAFVAMPIAMALWRKHNSAPAADETMWHVDPVVAKVSTAVPLTITAEGFRFAFPAAGGVDGFCKAMNSLPKAIEYEVTTAPGVEFIATEGGVARVSFMFQRKGDDWSASGGKEFYRWYLPGAPLKAGTVTMAIAPDDPNWISVLGKKASDNPVEFADALNDIDNISIIFGGNGLEHGVYATGDASFELLKGA